MHERKLSLAVVAGLVLVLWPVAMVRGAAPAERGKGASKAAAGKAGAKPAKGGPAVEKPAEPFSIEQAVKDLKQKFKAGGSTMWVILFLSVAALAFVLERTFRLRRGVIAPAGLAAEADSLWKKGDLDQIEVVCRQSRSTLARIIQFIVRHRTSPVGDISMATGDIASREIGRHLMLTYPLAAVATLSPLLGLFGTVIGMIEAFEMVYLAGTMGDPSILAGSISKALVTTAFGLLVAIPTLFFYHLFKLRTNYLGKLLEEEASTLMSEWLMKPEQAAQAVLVDKEARHED